MVLIWIIGEMANRAAFIDFCQGLLTLNPVTRWTPQQARMHPFITGEKFTKPFIVRRSFRVYCYVTDYI